MNVKPGDLAMVVRNTTGDGCVPNMIGTPVKIEARGPSNAEPGGPWWIISGTPLVCPVCKAIEFHGFLDADLQRMRGAPPIGKTTPVELQQLSPAALSALRNAIAGLVTP